MRGKKPQKKTPKRKKPSQKQIETQIKKKISNPVKLGKSAKHYVGELKRDSKVIKFRDHNPLQRGNKWLLNWQTAGQGNIDFFKTSNPRAFDAFRGRGLPKEAHALSGDPAEEKSKNSSIMAKQMARDKKKQKENAKKALSVKEMRNYLSAIIYMHKQRVRSSMKSDYPIPTKENLKMMEKMHDDEDKKEEGAVSKTPDQIRKRIV